MEYVFVSISCFIPKVPGCLGDQMIDFVRWSPFLELETVYSSNGYQPFVSLKSDLPVFMEIVLDDNTDRGVALRMGTVWRFRAKTR